MNDLLSDAELLSQEADMNALRTAYNMVSSNSPKGLVELEELASHGSIMAVLYLAHEYKLVDGPDNLIAEKWFRSAYESGSSTALLNLGLLYYRRNEYDQAEKIWLEGVQRHDGPSMCWLALMYLGKLGYHAKKDEAKSLFDPANELGQIRAQFRLGQLLISGQYGVSEIPRGLLLLLEFAISVFKTAYRKPDDQRLW